GRQGGRADRPPAGADEVRPGLAALEAEGAAEAPRQLAPLRRPGGAVLRGGAGPDGDRGGQRADGVDRDQRDRPRGVAVRDGEAVLQLAGPVSQLAEDRWPGQVQPDAPGGEPCGAGAADGGPEPAPQPGGPGRVPAADERAAVGSSGRDRDGAQAGPDRLSGVEARPDVCASESRGVRGSDEGEAAQGVAAEGPPVGAGDNGEDVG